MDFLAIGDVVVDEFIRLKEAKVTCAINEEECTISMRWGDKIPFEFAVLVPGVGNAANAAVAAARLGLSASLLAHAGEDRLGDEILKAFAAEKNFDASLVMRHADIPTNHHYVLWFESERTILVKHEAYPYSLPKNLAEPKTLYLSSLAEGTDAYHDEIASYAEAHPHMFFAFQPGTFQMKMGTERLKRIYARADFFVCNKEESQRILKSEDEDIEALARGLAVLGPKIVIITNGRDGMYALENGRFFHMAMFPDPKPPYERTGAGDAFASTTAAFLTSGLSLEEAMRRGAVNASAVVQAIGAQKGLLEKEALEKTLATNPSW
jgi:sugar/nucleoside kinase (ribokinase family)